MRKGNVALISQSGNSSQSIFNHGLEMGLGFSKFVSSGNEADLRFEDYLEYLQRMTKRILSWAMSKDSGKEGAF